MDAEEIEVVDSEAERAAEAYLAQKSIGAIEDTRDSVAQMLADYADREQGTNLFKRDEPLLYAKMTYLLGLTKAVGESDKNGFKFPDFAEGLFKPDYKLRTSVKQQTRKLWESITKIFERNGESGKSRGLFGGR